MKLGVLPGVICALIQIPFVIQDPSRWWNWLSIGFCVGFSVCNAMALADKKSERRKAT